MRNRELILKSFTIRGFDGYDLTLSETTERHAIVVSIQEHDGNGRLRPSVLTPPHSPLSARWIRLTTVW
jgi:hypothetical protein